MRTDERGQALGLALAVLAVTSLVASALVTSAWEATSSVQEAVRRGQAHQAAASAAGLTSEILRRIMTGPVVQNISSLGCRRQSEDGVRCVEPGPDRGLESGLRKSRIEQLARRSQDGWQALQEAFVEALRHVMPLSPEQDRVRAPAYTAFGGLVLRGVLHDASPGAIWVSYGVVAPIPRRPITYDSRTEEAAIPFELRAYAWAASDPSGRTSRAQVTVYATPAEIRLTYPTCPDYWLSPPPEICEYPSSVKVEIPESFAVSSDPPVRWVEP